MEITLRTAVADDQPFLWEMLYYAAHMDESGEPLVSARHNRDLAPYVEGFGRPDDCGVIALDAATGVHDGAAWIRQMPLAWPLYRFVDSSTPELAIAVRPALTGCKIGSLMLARLFVDAAATHSAIVLSVRANNPAKTLYKRFGFTTVAEITNRVGSTSLIMKATLKSSG